MKPSNVSQITVEPLTPFMGAPISGVDDRRFGREVLDGGRMPGGVLLDDPASAQGRYAGSPYPIGRPARPS